MVIAASGEALEQRSIENGPEGHRIGTVLGTSTGSIRAIAEFKDPVGEVSA
jgi:3-oxoacyl-(acyl-carrier-protein) synthase